MIFKKAIKPHLVSLVFFPALKRIQSDSKSPPALDVFTDSHHLAHEASAMHLRDAAGGRFEASAAAAAPAPRRNATISYSF